MDTSRDWEGVAPPASLEPDLVKPSLRNPRLIYADNRVHRPRCAVPLNDGIHVLYGGFPGYGAVGGGLGIVNVEEESVTMLGHEQVIPEQSTVSLTVLSEGSVIGGPASRHQAGADLGQGSGPVCLGLGVPLRYWNLGADCRRPRNFGIVLRSGRRCVRDHLGQYLVPFR